MTAALWVLPDVMRPLYPPSPPELAAASCALIFHPTVSSSDAHRSVGVRDTSSVIGQFAAGPKPAVLLVDSTNGTAEQRKSSWKIQFSLGVSFALDGEELIFIYFQCMEGINSKVTLGTVPEAAADTVLAGLLAR